MRSGALPASRRHVVQVVAAVTAFAAAGTSSGVAAAVVRAGHGVVRTSPVLVEVVAGSAWAGSAWAGTAWLRSGSQWWGRQPGDLSLPASPGPVSR